MKKGTTLGDVVRSQSTTLMYKKEYLTNNSFGFKREEESDDIEYD